MMVSRILCLFILLPPAQVQAHPFHQGVMDSFAAGFLHPFGGVDHLLAMLMIGMLAGVGNVRTDWRLPAAFVLMACAGFTQGAAGSPVLPPEVVELLIAASVALLGALLWLRLPWLWPVAAVGWLHGLVHGTELVGKTGRWDCMAGFVAASVLLHLFGLGLMLGFRQSRLPFWSGALAMSAGMVLLLRTVAG